MLYFSIALVFLLVCSSAASSQIAHHHPCTPFGVRLALGKNYANQNQSQMLSIWFNTKENCLRSYVMIEQRGSTIRKVYCQNDRLAYSTYETYVHRCSISTLSKGDNFEYLAYGWTGNDSDPPIPSASENHQSHLPMDGDSISMVIVADWSYLVNKRGIYDSLDDAFDYLLAKKDIDILYVDGDIAYDLSTGNGKNYEEFLKMMGQVSSTWPVIMVTGNHERKKTEDMMLFEGSFELYNMTKTNLTTLDFGSFSMLIFDPFQIVLNKGTKDYLFPRFEAEIDRLVKLQKPIVVSSHYPLACSGSSVHCTHQRFILEDFFQSMIDHHSVFYLGAHYHTYERLFPFIGKGNFDLQNPGPYHLTDSSRYLVSVVEGIAGNDDKIVESYGSIQPYTANLSFNQTGYGVMRVGQQSLSYEHYKATDAVNPIDSTSIDYSQLFPVKLNLREQ